MSDIKTTIEQAKDICSEKGIKLTQKRLNILASLMHADEPLSAYEIAEHYKVQIKQTIPAMSVYRMLDVLAENALVHKLESANKYIVCSHLNCSHAHQVPQFLICEICNSVTEIGIKSEVMEELRTSVEKTGFKLSTQQLELKGFCANCQ